MHCTYMDISVLKQKEDWEACVLITKILEWKSALFLIKRTYIHTNTLRAVGLFTDHYSWQWVLNRKCLAENNRTLLLQLKQHPSAIQCMCVCVCVCKKDRKKGRKKDFFPVTSVMQAWVHQAILWPSCSVSAHLHHPCQTQVFINSECLCVLVWVCESESMRQKWGLNLHTSLLHTDPYVT